MVGRALLIVAVAAAVLAGCERGDRYEVEYINADPRMKADAVVAMVRGALQETAAAEEAPDVDIDILTVRVMPVEEMPAAIPGIEVIGGNPPPSGLVWVVRANGPYLSMKGLPPGASGQPYTTATHGWFVVDDASGEIIAVEMDRR